MTPEIKLDYKESWFILSLEPIQTYMPTSHECLIWLKTRYESWLIMVQLHFWLHRRFCCCYKISRLGTNSKTQSCFWATRQKQHTMATWVLSSAKSSTQQLKPKTWSICLEWIPSQTVHRGFSALAFEMDLRYRARLKGGPKVAWMQLSKTEGRGKQRQEQTCQTWGPPFS